MRRLSEWLTYTHGLLLLGCGCSEKFFDNFLPDRDSFTGEVDKQISGAGVAAAIFRADQASNDDDIDIDIEYQRSFLIIGKWHNDQELTRSSYTHYLDTPSLPK